MPLPAKFPAVPFPTVISPTTKPVTDSLNVNVTGIGEVLVGLDAVEVIDTVGAVVSMIIALFAPREFAAPGEANVNVALFAAASRIVPPFSAREFVAT